MVPKIKETLLWPSKEALNGWREYFAISFPVTVMICAEIWSFEFYTLTSGYLGVAQQASQVILLNICNGVFIVGASFMEAICSLVGSAIGAN